MIKKTQRLTVYWARLVYELLYREGLDAGALFEQCGLDTSQLTDPAAYFEQDNFSKLWREASLQSGNPAIGLQLGLNAPINAFDVYSSSIVASSCLREALARAMRYQKIVGSAFALTVEDIDEGCQIIFVGRGSELPVAREGYDAALSLMASTLRMITNPPSVPLYVEFRYQEPTDLQAYQEAFNCPLRFSGKHYGICVDYSVLDMPLTFANKSIAAEHEKRLARGMKSLREGGLPDRVQHFIRQHLPGGEPTVQQIARALSISQRSLQRQLSREGVSFRELLDEERKSLASKYLADSTLPLQEITFLLGFADHSNFYRAFRRWFGCAPGEIRKTTRGPARIQVKNSTKVP